MILEEIGAALDQHTLQILTHDIIAWPGVHFEPDGKPYVAVSMPGYFRRPISIGQKGVFRHEGKYQLSVFHPSGEGIYEARRKADQIVSHFPRGLSLNGGKPVIESASALAPVIQPNWVMIPVQVSWFCDDIET